MSCMSLKTFDSLKLNLTKERFPLVVTATGTSIDPIGFAKSFLPKLCKELFTGFLVPGLFGSRLHLLSEVCACFGEW